MKTLIAWLAAVSLPLIAIADEKAAPAQAASSKTSLYELDASWSRQTGEKLEWKKSTGTPRVIALGYASCKDICPRVIADMQRIEQKLNAEERSRCRFTFVSLDPAHDTVAEMKKLGERHKVDDTHWDLLTGEEDAVLELAVALGIHYDRMPNGIDFAHSYLIAVIGPDGVVRHKWIDPGEGPDPSVAALRAQGGK